MRTRVGLVVLGVALLVGFAPAPFPRAERSRVDQTDVNGTWEFITWEHRGTRHVTLEQAYRAEVTREQYVLAEKQAGSRSVWVMRLNPSASPPSFTWTMGDRMTHVGSYRLNGNEMTMVFVDGADVSVRPTDLGASPNGWRFVMRRVKRD